MTFAKALAFLFISIFITNFAECSDDLPSTIERCTFEDNECQIRSWNKYIKATGNPNGLSELDIPSLRNYLIRKASISPGSGPLDIVLKMRDFNLTGLDGAVVEKITGFPKDPKEMTKFEVVGHLPVVGINGKYNVKGKVLLLPVAGDDVGEVKFYNVKFNVTVLTSTKEIDGKEFLVISKVICSYVSKRNHYRFENLFNNKDISDGINSVLNENQDIINNEIREPIGKIIAEIFKKFLVVVFNKYPYRSFFL